jgi:adhesin/invasin
MISRRNHRFLSLAFGLAIPLLASACEKVPLLAPSGSAIVLTSSATALPVNGTANLTAQVLDQSGYPPHSGTVITFTTTLGTVQPAQAATNASGLVNVTFNSGTANGTATIIATSGGAGASTSAGTTTGGTTTTASGNTVKIAIGTAAVGRVSVNASPATVPNTGGSTTISASVYDINGNALSSAPVSFTATAGTLSTAIATTGANGVAATILTTSQTSTVTASVGATAPAAPAAGSTTTPAASGAASGSVTVNISAAPTLVITPPTTAPSAGLPASFTFVVTAATANGSSVRDVTVNWGDGSLTQDLGAVTGTAIVSHEYLNPGSYAVTGIVTDATGNSVSVSTSVTVITVPTPTIIVTPTVTGTSRTVSFQLQVTAPTGLAIQNATITYGDGQSDGLGGLNGSATVSHTYISGTGTSFTVKLNVIDSLQRTTTGSTSVTLAAP